MINTDIKLQIVLLITLITFIIGLIYEYYESLLLCRKFNLDFVLGITLFTFIIGLIICYEIL
jgi:hypothetical protein